jgi:pre-mRNA cleavage complex 2 protein Pcf11
MDAYTLVEGSTRKEMEVLLKSWKQPTPLSRDPRPVLPGEITREIENALIKYRTVAFQAQQQARHYSSQMPSRGPQYRDSPTRHIILVWWE